MQERKELNLLMFRGVDRDRTGCQVQACCFRRMCKSLRQLYETIRHLQQDNASCSNNMHEAKG